VDVTAKLKCFGQLGRRSGTPYIISYGSPDWLVVGACKSGLKTSTYPSFCCPTSDKLARLRSPRSRAR
jgi:hypothetical protein